MPPGARWAATGPPGPSAPCRLVVHERPHRFPPRATPPGRCRPRRWGAHLNRAPVARQQRAAAHAGEPNERSHSQSDQDQVRSGTASAGRAERSVPNGPSGHHRASPIAAEQGAGFVQPASRQQVRSASGRDGGATRGRIPPHHQALERSAVHGLHPMLVQPLAESGCTGTSLASRWSHTSPEDQSANGISSTMPS